MICATGSGTGEAAGVPIIHARRCDRRRPARRGTRPPVATPGVRRAVARASRGSNDVVPYTSPAPRGVIQIGAASLAPGRPSDNPAVRFSRAPSSDAAPNTATAPTVAIASVRDRSCGARTCWRASWSADECAIGVEPLGEASNSINNRRERADHPDPSAASPATTALGARRSQMPTAEEADRDEHGSARVAVRPGQACGATGGSGRAWS